MIEQIPDVIVAGDIELFFGGLALGAGFPKIARRVINKRYETEDTKSDE